MTPKEKAKELIKVYIEYANSYSKFYSKKCALICVKEILTQLNKMESKDLRVKFAIKEEMESSRFGIF